MTASPALHPAIFKAYDIRGVVDETLTDAAVADPRAALASYMQADGIHPNAEGVGLIVTALGPLVEQLIVSLPQS